MKRRDNTKYWQKRRRTRDFSPTAGKVNWYTTSKKEPGSTYWSRLCCMTQAFPPWVQTPQKRALTYRKRPIHEESWMSSSQTLMDWIVAPTENSWVEALTPKWLNLDSALKEVMKVRRGRKGEIDPTGLVSLLEEEAAKTMWGRRRRRMATCEPRREADPVDTLTSDFQRPDWKKISFCCLNHPAFGTSLWQPKRTDTQPQLETARMPTKARMDEWIASCSYNGILRRNKKEQTIEMCDIMEESENTVSERNQNYWKFPFTWSLNPKKTNLRP